MSYSSHRSSTISDLSEDGDYGDYTLPPGEVSPLGSSDGSDGSMTQSINLDPSTAASPSTYPRVPNPSHYRDPYSPHSDTHTTGRTPSSPNSSPSYQPNTPPYGPSSTSRASSRYTDDVFNDHSASSRNDSLYPRPVYSVASGFPSAYSASSQAHNFSHSSAAPPPLRSNTSARYDAYAAPSAFTGSQSVFTPDRTCASPIHMHADDEQRGSESRRTSVVDPQMVRMRELDEDLYGPPAPLYASWSSSSGSESEGVQPLAYTGIPYKSSVGDTSGGGNAPTGSSMQMSATSGPMGAMPYNPHDHFTGLRQASSSNSASAFGPTSVAGWLGSRSIIQQSTTASAWMASRPEIPREDSSTGVPGDYSYGGQSSRPDPWSAANTGQPSAPSTSSGVGGNGGGSAYASAGVSYADGAGLTGTGYSASTAETGGAKKVPQTFDEMELPEPKEKGSKFERYFKRKPKGRQLLY